MSEIITVAAPPWPTCAKCGGQLGIVMVERPGPMQCFSCDPPEPHPVQQEIAALKAEVEFTAGALRLCQEANESLVSSENAAVMRADAAELEVKQLTEELRVGNALCARLTDRQNDVEHARDALRKRIEDARVIAGWCPECHTIRVAGHDGYVPTLDPCVECHNKVVRVRLVPDDLTTASPHDKVTPCEQ